MEVGGVVVAGVVVAGVVGDVADGNPRSVSGTGAGSSAFSQQKQHTGQQDRRFEVKYFL